MNDRANVRGLCTYVVMHELRGVPTARRRLISYLWTHRDTPRDFNAGAIGIRIVVRS